MAKPKHKIESGDPKRFFVARIAGVGVRWAKNQEAIELVKQ